MITLPPEEESIFTAARALSDPEKRRQYLDVACEGDRECRQTIEELLDAAEAAETFFRDPAAALIARHADEMNLPKPGKVMRYFGDYEVEEEIGRGGMGVIYRARQTSLSRAVAIKMILSGNLADEKEVKRFRSEAEAAASLQHPNIVSIHEVGVHEGQHYFSMDLVEGGSLAERILEEPMAAGEAAKCLRSIASAVAYAHRKGILHRDLKPQNILMDEHGEPHVTDFGLAKRLQDATQLTLTGSILGSPGFMSPEQARGQSDLVDARTDVYGLGALLYALLTSKAPIQGGNVPDTLRRVTDEDPISSRVLNPKVSQDLDNVCLKCLAKEPSQRYANADELIADLERFLNYEPVTARPAGTLRKTWTWWQKNPWKLMGLLGVAMLALIACIILFWERSRLAEMQLSFPGEDIRNALNPFSESPALDFLKLLPLCVLLIFVIGRSFRRQLKPATATELLANVTLPIHALAGAAIFLFSFQYLLQQIRFWVWRPEFYVIGSPGFALDVFATGCGFVLAWMGLRAIWEAVGSHDSAIFKAQVSRRLQDELDSEAQRRWSMFQVFGFSAGVISALSLAALALLLPVETRRPLATSPTVLLAGVVMVWGSIWCLGRMVGRSATAQRLSTYAVVSMFFVASVISLVQVEPLPSMAIGWLVGLLGYAGYTVLNRNCRKPDTQGVTSLGPGRLFLESSLWLGAMIVAFYVIENRRGEAAWRDTGQMLTDAGVDLTWNVADIPDDQNFATALGREWLLRPRDRQQPPAASRQIPTVPVDLRKDFEEGPFVDLDKTGEALVSPGLIPATATNPVESWLTQHSAFFDRVNQIAGLPHAVFPRRADHPRSEQFIPNYSGLRSLAQCLSLRTQQFIEQSDGKKALAELHTLSRLREILGSSDNLVSGMLAISTMAMEANLIREGIRQSVWTPEQLEQLETQLRKAGPLGTLRRSLHTEIAWVLDLLEESPTRWSDSSRGWSRHASRIMPFGWTQQMKSRYVRTYLDHLLPAVDVEHHRLRMDRLQQGLAHIQETKQNSSVLDRLVRIGIPNLGKVSHVTARRQTLVDLTRVACALERFRQSTKNHPEKLNELVPDWLDHLPTDVITGEALIYRRNPNAGYVLYSRGLNGTDDGGTVQDSTTPLDWAIASGN